MGMTGKELLEEYKKRRQGNNVSSKESISTPSKGTQITGAQLLDEYYGRTSKKSEETKFTFSENGQKGWQKYLDDKEAKAKATQTEREEETFWEKIGRYLSGGTPDTSLPMGTTSQVINDLRVDDGYKLPSDDWSDEQRSAFGELYLSDLDKAFNYAIETNNKNNKAKEEAQIKEIQGSSTDNFWAGAGHTAGAIASAPLGLADFLNDLAMSAAGREIASDGYISPFEYSQAVTGGISQDLNETYGTLDERIPIIGGKGWGDVYGLGTSIAQSAVSGYTLGGAGTLVSYFGQGAASGVDDALSRGATEEQAVLYGTALGVFEGLAESIGIDNLFKIGASATRKEAIKNVLRQAGAEGLEEGLTSILSNIADNAIMQDNSNFNRQVEELMALGMSEDEAKKKAWLDAVGGIAFDTFGGFVSGGVHAGAHTGVKTIISNHNASQLYGNQSQKLIDDALSVQNNRQLQSLAKEYQGRVDSGKNLKGSQINRLINTTDTAKLKNAILQRLGELGETRDVSVIADVLVRQAMGEKLSSRDTTILNNSKAGHRVLAEINKKNIKSGGLDNKWAENIGTRRVSPETYNKALYDLASKMSGMRDAMEKKSVAKSEADIKNATGEKFEASESGKTVYTDAKGNVRDATVKRIASTKGGLKVELKDGTIVNAKDLSFGSKEEALMYEMVARMEVTPGTANEIINTIKPSNIQEATRYFATVPLAYQYGAMKYEAGLKNVDLPDNLKRIAYNRGRMDALAQDKSKTKPTSQKGSIKAPTKKSGVIFENGYVYDESTANDLQKESMVGIELIDKMSNLEVHVFESKVVDGKRVAYVNGKLVAAPNGYFTDGNKIYIDINAGNGGEGAMLYTMSHEVTHYIRKWNAKGFRELGDFLIEQYGKKGVPVNALLNAQKEKIKKRYKEEKKALPSEAKLADMAYEELVADAMSDMFTDPKAYEKLAKLKQTNRSLWEKLGEAIKALLDKIKTALGVYKTQDVAVAQEAYLVRGFSQEVYDKLQNLYIKAFVEADNNYSSAETTLAESGIIVDSKTESASLLSVRDVLSDDDRKRVSKALAERFGVTQAEAMEWLKAETSMASLILNPKYSQYLDYTPDPNEVAIKQNSDYPQGTVDFSPICAKRREFTSVMNNILRLFPSHVFAATDLAKIRTIMQEEGMTIPCGICYVEDRRQLDTIVAQNFIDSLKLYREGSKTRPDGKPFNVNQLKGLSLIDGDSYTPSIYELVSLEGLNVLKEKNPNMAEAWVKFNNARGMQSVRLLANEAEYKRQILKYNKQTVKAKNDKGGLRVYSFSDAEMFHLIDIIQVITDSATVGLSLQGYTKVNEYARAVKDTGEKLNRSLIPKGELGYHIEDGEVVLDYDTVEGVDINHPDFFDNRDNPNVGNITIGINDVQIRAAMVSDFVDQIIPFHTGQSEEVLGEKGIATWDNYKDFQTEKDIDTGKVSEHQINIYTEVLQVLEKEGKPITKRTFVEKFLQVCKENNLTPRFSQFLNTNEKGEYVYTEGYHKMLVDFKTFAQTEVGEYLPQMPVKPIFDNEYITKILKDYVKSQKVKDAELAESMPKVIERITNEIVKPSDMKFSDRVLMGSLFSGGGTLEAGLVYQMLDKEFAVEYNKKIASVYTDNHGKEHMFVGDVRDFNSKEKQNVFYLHASPVCKNFSPASHSGGETTLDITTAEATARVLEEQMPQVFTVENVKRYINSEAYNIITNKLDELGYTWDVAVYKASDYGNATKRERMIIRAVKDGQLPAKPQKASNITSWGEATKDLWKTDLIPSYLVKSEIEAIKNTPSLKGVKLTKLDRPLLIYDTTKSKTINYAWADELAPTLTTKCGDARIIMPDGRVYAPTPKFMGRIQGLPDDYKYPKATTNAFKIIGNGIPTQLTKAVMGGVLDSAYEQTHNGEVLYSDREFAEADITYSLREEAPPKKTKKAYKLMRLVDGKLYPLFIGNNEEISVGTWYNADSPNLSQLKDLAPGTHLVDMETGEAITWDEYAEKYVPLKKGKPVRSKPNVEDIHWANDNGYRFMHIEEKAGGKSEGTMLKKYGDTRAYYNWGVNGSSKTESGEGSASLYALRPGWHFGEVPSMHQIGYDGEEGETVRLDNQVWVEVEMSADVDYNAEAEANWSGDIPTHIPTDGYYRYATNPTQKKTKGGNTENDATKADWYVAGAFKVNRIMSDSEADSIVEKYNKSTGRNVPLDYRRNYGRVFNAETMRVEDAPKYSERDTDSVSNRTLLANALESVAKNDIEKAKLAQYKKKIALIESEQTKLYNIKAEANSLRFTKGRTAAETKRMRDLDFEATQTANRINTYDKQLLNLEANEALKGVLEREKTILRKRLEQKEKEAIRVQKEKSAKTVRELMNRHTESRMKTMESRHKTEIRHKIKKVVSDLNKLLLNPTKEKHVPIGLQLPVAEALDAVNMDMMNAEERVKYYNDLIAKSSNPDEIAMLTKKRDFFEYRDANFKERITALKNAYAEFKESDDPLIRNAHNDAIEELIKNTADAVGNKSLKDMSLAQLEAVLSMYKAVLATVRNSNKMFKEGRQETVTQSSEDAKVEVKEAGGHQDRVLKLSKFFKKFGWDMLKPVTAMKVIGSKTLERLFNNVRAGEDTWAVDVNEAKDFYEGVANKYGFKKWDFKKMYPFKDNRGEKFTISLEQIMSLYAYSKRDQADKHLEFGGFIFDDAIEVTEKKMGIPLKYEVNDANPHRLRKEDVLAITDALTKEQKAFIDEMQTYLSEVMGEKGNEVSLAMYDIKLYNEKNYFPLKTSRYFREFDPEKSGMPKIKNSGFSKKTVPQAGNPIVLSNFMDVWASHVNDMSMYHAFVLPLEDFLRVYNYSSTAGGYDSVQQYIKNAYGSQANQYIERLMDDLNGGARVDSSAGIINKGISLFKKASVFASTSVVVQQPSAIARAFAYINPKYFATSVGSALNLKKHKEVWAEVKKYAPVAVIKEMGYFDTGMGRSTVEWIKGNNTIKDKIDNALSKAPALADELVWCHLWEAIKRETTATKELKAGSEDFYKECGRRFTEVITNTQVYDSVLSRSGMMRSKDTGMKMATAFMAEPTTTVNMMVDGIIQGKRGNKKFLASTVGAISASVILNAILVALVYAARDDDEDETYTEKYVGSVTSELVDGFNPLTYVPFVKDVWSIAQGYDVERSDMSVVSNLWESIEGLFNDNKSGWEKVSDATGAVSSLFGIPLKNLIRDAKGMYNLTETLLSGTPTTGAGISESIGDAFTSSIPLWDRLHDSDSNADRLYKAMVSGDQTQVSRIKSRYANEQAFETAMRQALRDNDSRIREAAQARYDGDIARYTRIAKSIISEGNFSQDIVVGAINAELSALRRGEVTTEVETEDKDEVTSIYSSSDINSAFDNGDSNVALEIIADLIETKKANGMEEKNAKSSVRSSMTAYWKPLYKQAYQSGDSAEMLRIRTILLSSGLYGSSNDVVKTVWEWVKS